jgi:hypothetical protein
VCARLAAAKSQRVDRPTLVALSIEEQSTKFTLAFTSTEEDHSNKTEKLIQDKITFIENFQKYIDW